MKIITLLGRFLMVFSLVFLLVKLSQHFHEIPRFTGKPSGGVLTFILAVLSSTTTIGIVSYIWAILLRGGGIFLGVKQAFIIHGKSQIGKYLPGNIFQYLARITLSQKAGIPMEAAVLSIGVEAFLLAGTAALIVGTGLLIDRRALMWLIRRLGINGLGFVLFAVVGSLAILSAVTVLLPRIRNWIRPRLTYLQGRRIAQSVLLCLFVFIIYGAIISLFLKTIWEIDTELRWYHFTWGFALAWVLGFIVPGAPAGMGIRETVLVGLYGVPLGEGVAIGLAAVLRIVTSLGDLFAFGLAYWLSKKEKYGSF